MRREGSREQVLCGSEPADRHTVEPRVLLMNERKGEPSRDRRTQNPPRIAGV